jgi:hypothetical protein
MKFNQNIFLIIALTIVFQTTIFCQINSDAFVSASGDLLANTPFTIKNEIENSQELVKKLYYDASGRLVFQRNYDFQGGLTYDNKGVAIYEYVYDEKNNIIEERYFDESKHFFQQENIGAAMIKRQFDAKNRVVEIKYFLAENVLLNNGTAQIKFEYAADGFTGMEKHFNAAGLLVDFCAPIVGLEFNTKGQVIRKTFMNSNQEPCGRFMDEDEDEVATIEYEYDGLGNVSLQRAFNKAGKLLGTINS